MSGMTAHWYFRRSRQRRGAAVVGQIDPLPEPHMVGNHSELCRSHRSPTCWSDPARAD